MWKNEQRNLKSIYRNRQIFEIFKNGQREVNLEGIKGLEIEVREHDDDPVNSDVNSKWQLEETLTKLQVDIFPISAVAYGKRRLQQKLSKRWFKA